MEDLLKGPYLMTEWNPVLIDEILSRLTPCNVRVLAIAKKFENIATETEPWHGGQYKTEEIKSDLIKEWETNVPNDKLSLPDRNPLIPTNFELCERDTHDSNSMPSVICDSNLSRVWFKQDDEYLLPKACLNFQIMSSVAYEDLEHANLNSLFVRLFKGILLMEQILRMILIFPCKVL